MTEASGKTVVVVSGLPRSGTSLMMQMLQAGGMPLLCDGRRASDEDNPQGYFEYEKVKALKKDASWLADAVGKAVKIITTHLYDLPAGYDYKVIFMERDLREILLSQKKMLRRRGETDEGPSDEVMSGHFMNHVKRLKEWLFEQPHMEVMFCSYRELVEDPSPLCNQIAAFIGQPLDIPAMLGAVDEKLYRNRM
ncbi:MAG: sulfotransferase domain-containing protein [Kiritimatiellia bacterium]